MLYFADHKCCRVHIWGLSPDPPIKYTLTWVDDYKSCAPLAREARMPRGAGDRTCACRACRSFGKPRTLFQLSIGLQVGAGQHENIHTYIQTYIHAYKHACMHTDACILTYLLTYLLIYFQTYIHTCLPTSIQRTLSNARGTARPDLTQQSMAQHSAA